MGTGQEWDVLLPLLVQQGLLVPTIRSTVSSYAVVKEKWDGICRRVRNESGHKCEWGTLRLKEGQRNFHVCFGKPLYKNPAQQFRANVRILERRSSTTKANQLHQLLQSCCSYLKRISLVERLKKDREKKAEKNTETELAFEIDTDLGTADKDAVEAALTEKISFALALDSKRTPRLTRSGEKEIIVHDRRQASERERSRILHTAVLWEWKDPQLS